MEENNKKTKEYSDIYTRDNSIATKLDTVAWIILVLGILAALGIAIGDENIGGGIVAAASAGFFALLIFALREIITILHDIRRKLFEKK